MGRRDETGNGRKVGQREQQDLTVQPFKQALRDVRAQQGELCLKCGEPIDSRLGLSLSDPRGSRGGQRHGWLHLKCEAELAEKFYVERFVRGPTGGFVRTVVTSVPLSVPVFSDSELDTLMAGEELS